MYIIRLGWNKTGQCVSHPVCPWNKNATNSFNSWRYNEFAYNWGHNWELFFFRSFMSFKKSLQQHGALYNQPVHSEQWRFSPRVELALRVTSLETPGFCRTEIWCKCQLLMTTVKAYFAPPTFLVLSMAFRIDMLRSSKAARTFSYSPRCWEKYSGRNIGRRRSWTWIRGCGCFVEAASGWHLSHTACRGFDCRACKCMRSCFFLNAGGNVKWYPRIWRFRRSRPRDDTTVNFLVCRCVANLPQSSSVSTLLESRRKVDIF